MPGKCFDCQVNPDGGCCAHCAYCAACCAAHNRANPQPTRGDRQDTDMVSA